MKIALYIFLGVIVLIGLIFCASLVYLKYFDNPEVAVSQLKPKGIFDQQIIDDIADMAKDLREETQFSIAVIKNDSTHHYGLHRHNNELTYISNESAVYEIGSITKVMTAYVIHGLSIEGQLSLDESASSYLPVKNDHLNAITIKTLLNHTSGLPSVPDNLPGGFSNLDDPYKSYDKSMLYTYLQSIDEPIVMQKSSTYSNLAYGILGAIAEEVTGQPISELYKSKIFEPLGMNNSSFYLDGLEQVVNPGKGPADGSGYHWNFDIMGAAGAVKSSADQMSHFVRELLRQGVITQGMQTESYSESETTATGLGLFMVKKSDDILYWHNGATGGYYSSMIYEPNQQLGIVVLTNRNMLQNLDNKLDALSFKIFRHLQSK